MIANDLIHLEHVHLRLLENSMHFVVASDLSLILWVLKVIRLDVLPQLLDYLWSRHLEIVNSSN
jgi:hypothetical protein